MLQFRDQAPRLGVSGPPKDFRPSSFALATDFDDLGRHVQGSYQDARKVSVKLCAFALR